MIFWLLAGLSVLVALGCVLLPLWRSQCGRVLGRRSIIVLCCLMPLTTLWLYRHLGAPAMLDVQTALQGKRHDVDAMLGALETRLQRQPDDAEGWFALGTAYLALKRLDDSEGALAKAVRLAPQEARYLSQYAELLALGDGGDLQKRAKARIDAALAIDPEDEKGLELAGLAAYQREEWTLAAFYWRRLLKRLPPGSEIREDIETALKQARGKAEGGASPPRR